MAALELNLLPDVKKEFQKARRQRNLVISISILVSIVAGGLIVALFLVMGGLQVQKNVLLGEIGADGTGKTASPLDKNSYIGKIKQAQSGSQDLNSVLTIQNDLAQLTKLKSTQPIFSRLLFGSQSNPGYLSQINPASPIMISLQQVQVGASSGTSNGTAATTTSTSANSNTITLQGTAWTSNDPSGSYNALNSYVMTLKNTMLSYSSPETKGKVTTVNLFPSVTVTQQQLGSIATSSSSSSSSNSGSGATSPVSFTIVVTYDKAAFAVDSTNISLKVPQKTSSDAIVNAPRDTFGASTTTNSTSTTSTGGSNE